MARILAIDYGEKRTGMAWTDPMQIAITPLPTIQTEIFEEKLNTLLHSEEVERVVFGLPTHSDGQLTIIGKRVKTMVNKLVEQFDQISFDTIDESFSSQRARSLMIDLGTKKKKRQNKENIDQMSAVIILKDYLNKIS